MLDKLEGALAFHEQALYLRHERQMVLAANIANADTPNFKARDFDFSRELSAAIDSRVQRGVELSRTHAVHIEGRGSGPSHVELLYRVPDMPSLDGNTVNMDRERVHFAENTIRYQASLVLLNSRIQGLKSAMRPE